MSASRQALLDQYSAALRDYVARADEADLQRAYELGRQMVGDERAMLDLVEVYHRELALLLPAAPAPDDRDRTIALAQAFFSESLSPFAMAQRGFRDAIARLRDLHQLLEFQHAISGASQLSQVVARVVTHAGRLPGAEGCALLLPRPDGSWERVAPPPEEAQTLLAPAAPEQDLIARAIQVRDPIVLDMGQADRGGDADRRGGGSQLAVALRSGKQVLGVLMFQATAAGAFGPTEVALAHLMAEYTAQALGQAGLLEELRQQNTALEAATRHKSAFLANMSHELRTPLNAIIGFTELMHDGKVGPVSDLHQEYLGDILTSSRHLLQIINDILDLAKVEAGKIEFRPEEVDLATLVGEVRDVLLTLAATKSLRIEVTIDPTLGHVVIDPARLKQVLYNYLSNAIKFTPDHGRVTIRVAPEDTDYFRLEVEDSGIGIQPQDLERLFVEFQQLDAGASKRYQGTGLGLALTRRIVEAQGGRVGVRSMPGMGSVFCAVLPRVAAPARADTAASRTPRGDFGQGTCRTARRRILVVEDERKNREWLVRILADAGYAVTAAESGAEALSLCRRQAFDAVTLDLLLPDMDGCDVLRALRAEERQRDVPVIVVTVVADKGYAAGFAVHDFLTKPVTAEDLLGALERAGIPPEGTSTVLVVEMDAAMRKLMEVALSQRGYRPICVADGENGLRAVVDECPAAVILDLAQGLEPFAFLGRLRATVPGSRTAVLVWASEELTWQRRAQLEAAAQAVAVKGPGGTQALLEELQAWLAGEAEGGRRKQAAPHLRLPSPASRLSEEGR